MGTGIIHIGRLAMTRQLILGWGEEPQTIMMSWFSQAQVGLREKLCGARGNFVGAGVGVGTLRGAGDSFV